MLVTDTSFGTVVVDTVCDPKSRLAGNMAMPDAIVDADSAIFPAAHTKAIEIVTPATLARRRLARCPIQRIASTAGHINIGSLGRGSR